MEERCECGHIISGGHTDKGKGECWHCDCKEIRPVKKAESK